MNLFLDSSAVIEFFRNNREVTDLIAGADAIYTSSICSYEVIFGEKYAASKRRRSSVENAKKFFETIATLPFTYDSALIASDLMLKLSSKGKKVDEFDVLIASQAMATGAVLLTKDARHFNIIKEEFKLDVRII